VNYRGHVRKSGVKGGRPPGAGNRTQMAPCRGGSFGCRSARFTGVYKAQRATVRWRTQFSYARKVGAELLLHAWMYGPQLHAVHPLLALNCCPCCVPSSVLYKLWSRGLATAATAAAATLF
jgi:hypothetical protein